MLNNSSPGLGLQSRVQYTLYQDSETQRPDYSLGRKHLLKPVQGVGTHLSVRHLGGLQSEDIQGLYVKYNFILFI